MNNNIEAGKGRFKRKMLAQSLALGLGTTLLGSAWPALAAAPLAMFFGPPDNAADARVNTDLSMGFDQAVSAVAGKNLVIRKSSDNSVVETIAVNDTAKVTLSASKATINPSADLAYSTGYYVQIDAGAFVNAGGEAYAGIADATSWNFTTGSQAAATLGVSAYSPTSGSTEVLRTTDLSMSFAECATPVAGKNIVIKELAGNSVVETIAVNDSSKVALSCSKQAGGFFPITKAVINPANDLLFGTSYSVQIDSGAFIGDGSKLSYAGILDNSTWTFSTLRDTVAPSVPAGVKATTAGANQVNLQWTASTDNAGVTAYKVYRNDFLVATRGNVTNYSDTGLIASTAYSYTVVACDAAGNCSSLSTPASTKTEAAPLPADTEAPTVPSGLTATAAGTGAIYLSWGASTDNLGVTGYKLYRGATPLASLGNSTSYTDSGLAASTAYSYSVAACDQAGNCSAQSSAVSATTNTPPKPITSTAEVVVSTNANVSVNSAGSLVINTVPDQPPPTVVLKTDGATNVDVKLPTGQPVIISSNGVTQQITDVSGQSQFTTTSKGGVAQLELVKGQVKVEADKSGTTVSITSSKSQTTGSLVTSVDKTTVAVVKDEKKATVFVDSGKVDYAAGSKPTVPVYQGENTTIDPGGNLTQLALGSKNGEKQVPGDPLPVTVPKDSATKIPNLEGALPRFENKVSLLDIVGDEIKALVGDTSGQLSYDKTTGVITYTLGNRTVRMVALGDVLVQLNQFTAGNLSATASGALSLASRGIQMSLAGALGYFSDLQSVVKAFDSNGQLALKPTGAIEIRMGGGRYVATPGLYANLPSNPTPLPGFESDSSGFAVFRDRLGVLQTLYPTFLEADSLTLTFGPLVSSLSLTNNGDGTVTAVVGGQAVKVRPGYAIIDRPLGHDADRYWLENGIIFFRNSDESAQGFGF